MKVFTTNENCPIGTLIGSLNTLLWKSEFQSQGFSILISLFGSILMSVSQNDVMQQTIYAIFVCESFRILKKTNTIKKEKFSGEYIFKMIKL